MRSLDEHLIHMQVFSLKDTCILELYIYIYIYIYDVIGHVTNIPVSKDFSSWKREKLVMCSSHCFKAPSSNNDIDECAAYPGMLCSQRCVNTIGSYRCECEPGYTLQMDKTSCRLDEPRELLLVDNR